MFARSLESDARVDRFNLEKAAEEQSGVYAYWAEQAAEAKRIEEGIEIKLKLRKADADSEIRATGEKITEAGVTARITKDEQVRTIEDELLNARKNRNVAEAAVRAMDHRKSMIETLSRLWVAGYYGDPTKDRASELTQRGRAALNGKLNTES